MNKTVLLLLASAAGLRLQGAAFLGPRLGQSLTSETAQTPATRQAARQVEEQCNNKVVDLRKQDDTREASMTGSLIKTIVHGALPVALAPLIDWAYKNGRFNVGMDDTTDAFVRSVTLITGLVMSRNAENMTPYLKMGSLGRAIADVVQVGVCLYFPAK
jgi:hypothetical protein